MKIEPGDFCPLLKEDCIKTKCKWFRPVGHINNATKEHYDEWDCVFPWLVVLQKDAISAALTTTASTDKMCNEVVKRMDTPQQIVQLSEPDSPLAIGSN
jgi:hypothetical protein